MEQDISLNGQEYILFVCTGNTCRSPMAEALFNCKYSGGEDSVIAKSCGIYADGSPISTNAEKALEAFGIKGFYHISQGVSRELLRQASKIIGISKGHASALIMQYPEYATKIYAMPFDIPDPYGGDEEAYMQCLVKIDEALKTAFGGGEDK